jgi:hypothetical protein
VLRARRSVSASRRTEKFEESYLVSDRLRGVFTAALRRRRAKCATAPGNRGADSREVHAWTTKGVSIELHAVSADARATARTSVRAFSLRAAE